MKVKLRVHYGTHKPGDTPDIKPDEAKYLISTRQAVAFDEDVETVAVEDKKPADKKNTSKSGDGGES
jgi:hypothetical protein